MREPSVAATSRPPCEKGLRRVAALVLALGLVGCGQKGPLTLPTPATAAAASAAGK
jgi:predicted small lipoprotein YifL